MFKTNGSKASPADSVASVGKFQRSAQNGGVGKMQRSLEETKKGMASPPDLSKK